MKEARLLNMWVKVWNWPYHRIQRECCLKWGLVILVRLDRENEQLPNYVKSIEVNTKIGDRILT